VDATPAHHIKLYNSGNFFDRQAVPPEDHAAIADRLSVFRTVIVENHPKLCGDDVPRFRDLLNGDLEVALGLETVHPDILPRLNKRMTLDDYARAADFLLSQRCHVRSFILLRPPFLDERDGIDWALRSLEYAFDRGARCCSVIPARGGNGIMERLEEAGAFSPPRLTSLEVVLEEGLNLKRGRVFVDLWDAERLAACPDCAAERIERLRRMNLTQCLLPRVSCACE
jgi:radical SAM enzyme (TIGR01210 family)